MRHGISGRQLGRTKDERRRLFMILSRSLFVHGAVKTTIGRAKAVQPMVEKLITKAKKADNASLLQIRKVLADKVSVSQLLDWAKTRFSTRTSGFTRLVKLGQRVGDGAEEVMLSFVDAAPVADVAKPIKANKSGKVQEAEVVEKSVEKKQKAVAKKKVAAKK